MPTDENLGRIIAGRYRVRRSLGSGAHGHVYLAEDLGRGGGHVALKLVEGLVGGAPEDAADDLLRRFRHPRWAAVLDQGVRGNDAWFQAVHYVRGTSLDQLSEPHPPELVYRLLEDGARVLGALHRLGLIHYDVTPGNVMLSDDGGTPQFILTDGGLAHLGQVRGVARGTPLYMAPEVTEEGSHDHRADLYALGLVAYRLATGREPFQGAAGDVLGKRRRQEAPRASTFRPDLPQELDDLLAELLARDPNARPHDALAVLARLDAVLPHAVPTFLQAEGVAAAEGGHLAGHKGVIERFDAGLGVLKQRIAAGEGRLARARLPLLEDPVMILGGVPGAGCTRVADECFTRARDGNVPALVMSGRETTGDRRGPLRHLVDGMAAIGLGPDDEYREIRLDLGTRRGLGREERSHTLTRAVEAFVRGVETTAARTPFVLVVEDFVDLPERAQEATRVLARHLLARRESGGATSAPPVLLMIDMGAESPESLLVPDASEPERPIVQLGALAATELAEICAERFPGLEPVQRDLERIVNVSEGLPSTLVTLMAEGCRRGDLRYESGRWNWNVDKLADYDIERGLNPVHADALRSASDALVRLLGYLSLVESPLDEGIVRHLWAKQALTPIPVTALIRTLARGDHRLYTTTNLAIRKAVLARLAPELRDELATHLLEALNHQDLPETALDRARLARRVGQDRQALSSLTANWERLPLSSRASAQILIAELSAAPLNDQGVVEQLAKLLDSGVHALSAARNLSEAIVNGAGVGHAATISVCRVLWAARDYALALRTLDAPSTKAPRHGESVAERFIWKGELLFWLHRESEARSAVGAASEALRCSRGHRPPEAAARYLMLVAQSEFLRGHGPRALRALRVAGNYARKSSQPALRARVMNSMGIVLQQTGDHKRSRAQFERALKLRTLLGDIEGVIGTTLNLGRAHQFAGTLVKGAAHFQAAATTAQRFAHHGALAMALRFLAQIYDQQLNTRLAAATFTRVVQLSERVGNDVELMQAAWELAPISAATGDHDTCMRMLAKSSHLARTKSTGYARATYHLVCGLTAMHLGDERRAALCIGRAHRRRHELFTENAALVSVLMRHMNRRTTSCEAGDVSSSTASRPPRGERARTVYRAQIWSEAALSRSEQHLARLRDPLSNSKLASHTLAGRERRLIVELAMLVASRGPTDLGKTLLPRLQKHLAHTSERYLLGRVLAVSSVHPGSSSDASRAQKFSRAVELVDVPATDRSRLIRRLPDEHIGAHELHSRHLGTPESAHTMRAIDQHALAHRLLVHHGCTTAPDGRVAAALRRVLAATGRMNAGAGLDDLLEGMTQDTIEITGAERACVVLVAADTDREMRVATSASAAELEVDVEDLSQTVIQRVIDARTPLLMHDVFDDEELMGRPSITSLSLRSILCVPMTRGDTLYGVLYADSSSAAGSFDGVDQEVLSLFAEQAAAALETHRLVADVQNSMDELKAMQERLVKGERLRTMGELSSGVAHEFNNLLTSILARVQLISLNNIGRELKQDLDLIEKACLDAAEVVRRLQSYTRSQRQEHYERVDIGDICKDAVEFLRPLWSTRRRHGREPIHVQLRAGHNLQVQGNPTELREVVTNLLKNALDALADGGEVQIKAERYEDFVRLLVEDNGPGIPEEIRPRVFDPFFTTKGERGTGLGLCLSQQIVDRHGGEMLLDSRTGEGTRFVIEFPSTEMLSQIEGVTHGSLEGMQPKLRVLVVDDDENVRRPLCRFLERSGYDVLSAQDGEEADTTVRDHRPDVVISDVAMPGIDGLELCRRIKRDYPELPVVLMSGWTSGVDPSRARRAGAASLLAKPFALQQVTELLAGIEETAHDS